VIVGGFNTPLSPIDRSSCQKINKEMLDINDTIDQMHLIDVYSVFLLTTVQYTFLSAALGIFSKIDHILGKKKASRNIRKQK
jgi:hypothetical protein